MFFEEPLPVSCVSDASNKFQYFFGHVYSCVIYTQSDIIKHSSCGVSLLKSPSRDMSHQCSLELIWWLTVDPNSARTLCSLCLLFLPQPRKTQGPFPPKLSQWPGDLFCLELQPFATDSQTCAGSRSGQEQQQIISQMSEWGKD